MATQLLVNVLSVGPIAPLGAAVVAHGLKSDGQGVVPTQVICDRASPLSITNADATNIYVANLSDSVTASANFRAEYDHSIHAVGAATLAWKGYVTPTSLPPSGTAGGDLSGTYPNPTVDGIQGYGIAPNLPANGDALLFNSALNIWEHSPIIFSGGPPTGPAGGDLAGLYPDPSLAAVGTSGVKGSASSVPVFTTDSKGRVTANTNTPIQIGQSQVTDLVTDLGNKADDTITITGDGTVTGGGNLTANRTLGLPNVGPGVTTKGSSTTSAVVTTDAQGRISAMTETAIAFPTSLPPSGAAGGDLTGTYPNPTLAAVGSAGTYGSSTSVPVLTTDTKGRVTGVVNTAIAFGSSAALLKMGNIALVDAVNGNNATASINGLPFLTVEAALTAITAAGSPATMWILPGTYTLASATTGLTLPNGCTMRGHNTQTTRIVMNASNPGGTVTMLTMGENSRVEDLSLTLNSSNATTNLVGIALPGTTSVTSKLRTAVLTVDNSGLAAGTTTNVTGILANGGGTLGNGSFSFNFTRGVTVNVFSDGGGNKRGVNVTTATDITFRDTNIYVREPTDVTSTGSYVGCESANAACSVQFRTCSLGSAPFTTATTKLPVVVAATTNITLSGTYVLQGVTLTAGMQVLAAGQTIGTNNGIWVVAAGAWARAADMAAGSASLNARTRVYGGTYANTTWTCTTNGTVGTNALTFVQLAYTGSDILQTTPSTGFINNGIQIGPGGDLLNKTAGGKPFTTYVTPTTVEYGLQANVAAAARYLWPGVQTASDTTQVFYRFQQKSILQGMFVNLRTAPGAGDSITVTVLRSSTGIVGSGFPTLMVATVSGTATSATQYTVSEDFQRGEYLAVQIQGTAGNSAQDVLIQLDFF